jgi:hypothetical protein
MATGTNISAAKSRDTRTASERSSSSQDVVVDCLSTYAQVYRETLTPELIVAYQNCLADTKPEILARAFLRAMRSSTFRPTPAEVRQCYAIEFENAPKPKQLELPEMSQEERAEVEKSFAALRARIGLPARPKVDEKKRRAELAKQQAEILAKHPPAKGKK